MKILLHGREAGSLERHVAAHDALTLVREDPDIVLSYGGDGTLLAAERLWPGIPKVPVRNSRRGNRTLHHPPEAVLQRLVDGLLVPAQFIKLEGVLREPDNPQPAARLIAMNEFNVHMAQVNSAVRFRLWVDEEAHTNGHELIGDGLLISTPFGSTAYFNHVTRGIFYRGIGVAFNHVAEHTTHLVLPEEATVRVLITRGPAILAYDSAPEYHDLREGSELTVTRAPQPATILTWGHSSRHPSQIF